VTTFKHGTKPYKLAMYNRGLDRDKDGVACRSNSAGLLSANSQALRIEERVLEAGGLN
jgi:hypothetical protein